MPPRLPIHKRRQRESQMTASTENKRRRLQRPSSYLHRQCEEIITRILLSDKTKRHGASIKSLTLASHIESKKATHAIVCETLRHLDVIRELLRRSDLHQLISENMTLETAYVLIYETLFGQGTSENDGKPERTISALKETLQQALSCHLKDKGVQNVQDLVVPTTNTHPRYVRINCLKVTISEALEHFRQLKMDPVRDSLMWDVLRLSSRSELHSDELVKTGSVAIQGYGSCLASHCLKPDTDWTVLDACAAPGNKTTHLASLMGDRGRIVALDLNLDRLSRLKETVDRFAAKSIDCRQMDFLQTNPLSPEFKSIDAILLDPSCTGSGTSISRQDELLPSTRSDQATLSKQQTRLHNLTAFQRRALKHALTFPSVKRIVYSTCSVYEEENEHVVEAVLSFAIKNGFQLRRVMPNWHRRGRPLFDGCEAFIRIDPEIDDATGFFIAAFERDF